MTLSQAMLSQQAGTGKGYFSRLFRSIFGLDLGLPLIEKALLGALVLMLGVSAIDAFYGHGVGDEEAIRLAKITAQQELMAQGPHPEEAKKQ